jgi:hypothetical protein
MQVNWYNSSSDGEYDSRNKPTGDTIINSHSKIGGNGSETAADQNKT